MRTLDMPARTPWPRENPSTARRFCRLTRAHKIKGILLLGADIVRFLPSDFRAAYAKLAITSNYGAEVDSPWKDRSLHSPQRPDISMHGVDGSQWPGMNGGSRIQARTGSVRYSGYTEGHLTDGIQLSLALLWLSSIS
jgi:hypothetical protein